MLNIYKYPIFYIIISSQRYSSGSGYGEKEDAVNKDAASLCNNYKVNINFIDLSGKVSQVKRTHASVELQDVIKKIFWDDMRN